MVEKDSKSGDTQGVPKVRPREDSDQPGPDPTPTPTPKPEPKPRPIGNPGGVRG